VLLLLCPPFDVAGISMNEDPTLDPKSLHAGADDVPELELTDEDIMDAMQHIPGYIDITTQDFRAIYHLAHCHALERLFHHIRAGNLMRTGIEPLHPDTRLDEAARTLARQRRKGLPVVDDDGRPIGMLTETDFLRCLKADTFLELLLRLVEDEGNFTNRCHETPTRGAMTAPPITVAEHAEFREIIGAFHAHEGRSMPVVDEQGRLKGLLLRKDFVRAYHLEDPL
jgi:CBS domain-containing membrane protein